jgi:2-acylglycerol O-acyltransferase 2
LDENDEETKVVSANGDANTASPPTVFGYHPHGLIPTGSIWMSMTREFRERFGGLKPVTLAASALFRAPVVRELAAWMGVRSVSSSIFISALTRERAVVVVPGGQREMAEHIGGVSEEEMVFCTKHRGFIRIAIECHAQLVPVVVFGESASYRNVWRSMGRFFYKKFRMAMPLFAVGYGGVLPLPSRVPLTFVIGAPLTLPKPDAHGVARASDIERAHAEYYARVRRMFEKHKAASGFPNLKLTLKHD